jgi:hypothetical protein
MAWEALDDMRGPIRRTWVRRSASGAAETRVDPVSGRVMVWVGWPDWRQRALTATGPSARAA